MLFLFMTRADVVGGCVKHMRRHDASLYRKGWFSSMVDLYLSMFANKFKEPLPSGIMYANCRSGLKLLTSELGV